jgi:hypothetical protein
MHAATLYAKKNVGFIFKQNENRETMLATNLASVILNKMRNEKPCLLSICLWLLDLQGSYDFNI